MRRNSGRRKFLIRVFMMLCLAIGILSAIAPFALADISTSQEQQVVNDFATFIINILTGPVSKILGAILLIGGVAALLNGKHGIALACGFGFMVLMFIPKILQNLFQQ